MQPFSAVARIILCLGLNGGIHNFGRQGFALFGKVHQGPGVSGVGVGRQGAGGQLDRNLHIARRLNRFAFQRKPDNPGARKPSYSPTSCRALSNRARVSASVSMPVSSRAPAGSTPSAACTVDLGAGSPSPGWHQTPRQIPP